MAVHCQQGYTLVGYSAKPNMCDVWISIYPKQFSDSWLRE